jgi:hypothetical protein
MRKLRFMNVHLTLGAVAAACTIAAQAQSPAPAPSADANGVAQGVGSDPYGEANRVKGGEATPKAKS